MRNEKPTDYIRLEDLEIYQLAMEIGDLVWNIIEPWDFFAKKNLGGQYVRAADSIAANISEGYGRFFYKEKKQFSYYSRESLQETKAWTVKAKKRKLLSSEQYDLIISKLATLHHKLNIYIKKLKGNIR